MCGIFWGMTQQVDWNVAFPFHSSEDKSTYKASG